MAGVQTSDSVGPYSETTGDSVATEPTRYEDVAVELPNLSYNTTGIPDVGAASNQRLFDVIEKQAISELNSNQNSSVLRNLTDSSQSPEQIQGEGFFEPVSAKIDTQKTDLHSAIAKGDVIDSSLSSDAPGTPDHPFGDATSNGMSNRMIFDSILAQTELGQTPDTSPATIDPSPEPEESSVPNPNDQHLSENDIVFGTSTNQQGTTLPTMTTLPGTQASPDDIGTAPLNSQNVSSSPIDGTEQTTLQTQSASSSTFPSDVGNEQPLLQAQKASSSTFPSFADTFRNVVRNKNKLNKASTVASTTVSSSQQARTFAGSSAPGSLNSASEVSYLGSTSSSSTARAILGASTDSQPGSTASALPTDFPGLGTASNKPPGTFVGTDIGSSKSGIAGSGRLIPSPSVITSPLIASPSPITPSLAVANSGNTRTASSDSSIYGTTNFGISRPATLNAGRSIVGSTDISPLDTTRSLSEPGPGMGSINTSFGTGTSTPDFSGSGASGLASIPNSTGSSNLGTSNSGSSNTGSLGTGSSSSGQNFDSSLAGTGLIHGTGDTSRLAPASTSSTGPRLNPGSLDSSSGTSLGSTDSLNSSPGSRQAPSITTGLGSTMGPAGSGIGLGSTTKPTMDPLGSGPGSGSDALTNTTVNSLGSVPGYGSSSTSEIDLGSSSSAIGSGIGSSSNNGTGIGSGLGSSLGSSSGGLGSNQASSTTSSMDPSIPSLTDVGSTSTQGSSPSGSQASSSSLDSGFGSPTSSHGPIPSNPLPSITSSGLNETLSNGLTNESSNGNGTSVLPALNATVVVPTGTISTMPATSTVSNATSSTPCPCLQTPQPSMSSTNQPSYVMPCHGMQSSTAAPAPPPETKTNTPKIDMFETNHSSIPAVSCKLLIFAIVFIILLA